VFHNQAAFEERVQREARSILRTQVGVEDPAEVQRRLNRLTELETAEATRQREALTEQQRLQADLDKEKQRAAEAERQARAAGFRADVTAICASKGIRNVNYALFVVNEQLPEAERAAKADAHLTSLLDKPEYRSAFGIPSDPVVPAPVTTSPTPGQPPPDPPRSGTPPPVVDAMGMSPEAFSAHLASLGAHQ
jgi:hypothetical protein